MMFWKKNIEMEIPVVGEEDYSYKVNFRDGYVHTLTQLAKDVASKKDKRKVAIITDSNVKPLYGDTLRYKLLEHGISPELIWVPAGEQSKTLGCAHGIMNFLSAKKFDRNSTLLIALGGGVIGDLIGTVALLHNRGVDYTQVPTTLLAQVDSSIGFKVAVDTEMAKNGAGGFYPPKVVWTDVSMLKTLDRRQYSCGLAEVIKMATSSDRKLFDKLSVQISKEALNPDSLEANLELVQRACEIKKRIVSLDPRERNSDSLRAVLNLGHTIGHAYEFLSGYTLLHGEAVSVGTVGAAHISLERGMLTDREFALIENTFSSADLPVRIPDNLKSQDAKAVIEQMKLDKKSEDGIIYMVLPEKIGVMARESGRYRIAVKEDEITRALDYLRN